MMDLVSLTRLLNQNSTLSIILVIFSFKTCINVLNTKTLLAMTLQNKNRLIQFDIEINDIIYFHVLKSKRSNKCTKNLLISIHRYQMIFEILITVCVDGLCSFVQGYGKYTMKMHIQTISIFWGKYLNILITFC